MQRDSTSLSGGGTLACASHFALPPALYAVGLLIGVWHLAGHGLFPPARTMVYVGAAALSVYLFDRVKLPGVPMDETDRTAHPARWAFLSQRVGLVRTFAFVAMAGAIAAGAVSGPLLAVLPALGIAAIWVYAGRRRTGKRPKDLFVVKNLMIALGLTVLVGACAVVDGDASWHLAIVCGWVFVVVAADAALCDLDDLEADRTRGTRTLPVVAGRGATWRVALGAHLLAAALAVAARPDGVGFAWALGLVVGTAVPMLVANAAPVRDLVDLRLPLLAGVVTAMWWTQGGAA